MQGLEIVPHQGCFGQFHRQGCFSSRIPDMSPGRETNIVKRKTLIEQLSGDVTAERKGKGAGFAQGRVRQRQLDRLLAAGALRRKAHAVSR